MESDKKTTIFNFYGGPGTGKSTTAAWAYAILKQDGRNAELVREYVKDWAWEGRKVNAYDQIYLTGKQIRRESLLYGKADVVVTDSPVLGGVYYARRYSPQHIRQAIEAVVFGFYDQLKADGHPVVHVLLKRSKPYEASGRYQTETEARAIDLEMRALLEERKCSFVECDTDVVSIQRMLREHAVCR